MKEIKVLKGGRLFDGTGGEVIENSVVVIKNDRFCAIGGADGVEIPKGPNVEIIDTTGMTVLPGLIESHMHINLDCSEGKHLAVPALEMNSNELLMRSLRKLRDTYEMGFTTIRDGGSGWNWIECAIRDGFARGDVPGPRFLTSGYHLTVSGGHACFMPPHLGQFYPMEMGGYYVDGVEEWRKMARVNLWNGVDNIKVVASRCDWTMNDHFTPFTSQATLEEMRAAVEVAETVGIPVMSHACGKEAIMKSIEAGVNIIVHGDYMDEECAELMSKKGIYWDPTNTIVANVALAAYGRLPERIKRLHPECVTNLHNPQVDNYSVRCWEDKQKNFMRIVKNTGVKVLVGTDAGCPLMYHGMNAMEMETDVMLGLSPRDALIACTKIAAESMGLEKEIGTVEVGKCADLVVVDGDPFADIGILQEPSHIKKVYHNGTIVIER